MTRRTAVIMIVVLVTSLAAPAGAVATGETTTETTTATAPTTNSYEIFRTFDDGGNRVAYNDGELVAYDDGSGAVNIRNTNSGLLVTSISGVGSVLSLSMRDETVVVGDLDGNVYVADAVEGTIQSTFTQTSSSIEDIAFSPDGSQIAYSSLDGNVYIHNIGSGALVETLTADFGAVNGVDWAPNGERIVFGGLSGNIRVHETGPNWNETARATIAANDITTVAFSPDGSDIAWGTQDNSVVITDSGGNETATLTNASDTIQAVDWSRNGEKLGYKSASGKLFIHERSSWEYHSTLTGLGGSTGDVSWRETNTVAVTTGGSVKVASESVVDGTVTDSAGNPIPDAIVSGGGKATTTDGSGNYALSMNSPGTYDINVQFNANEYGTATKTVDVPEDGTTLSFTSVTTKPTGISGTVLDNHGRTVAGAEVTTSGTTVETAPDGEFTIPLDSTGDYTVEATASGYSTGFETVSVDSDGTDGVIITIESPEIKGIVTRKDSGVPISDASVSAAGLTVATNSTGHYSVNVTSGGTWVVEAAKHGFYEQSESVSVSGTTTQNFALEEVDTSTDELSFTDPEPADNAIINSTSVELAITTIDQTNINAETTIEFRNAQNDDLIAARTIDLSNTGQDRASVIWNVPEIGDNSWYVVNPQTNSTSDTFSFGTPGDLFIRDEQTAELLDNATVTVRFFDVASNDDVVVERTTTNGKVSLDGLPNTRFIVDADSDGYHQRSILIRDIGKQQTAYLLNKSADSVDVGFEVVDRTGNFPADESALLVRKPVPITNDDNELVYQTVLGDELGAEGGVEATLERGARHRVLVENANGDTRSFGSYRADLDGDLLKISIGEISIAPPGADDYTVQASETTINTIDETRDAIKVKFANSVGSDDASVAELSFVIHERGNRSNIIAQQTLTGPTATSTITIPESENVSAWTVQYSVNWIGTEREQATGQVFVGDISEVNVPLPPELLEVLAIGGLLLIAGLFGGALSQIGGIVVVVVAWGLKALGWLNTPAPFLAVATLIAIFYLVGADRRGVRA